MDERFESVKHDHRFRPIRQAQRKVQIDKRFQGIFFNKKFRENFTVDKRGRPIRESTSKNLRKFYHLSKEERKRIHKERIKDREELRKRLEGQNRTDSLIESHKNGEKTQELDKNDLGTTPGTAKNGISIPDDGSDSDSSYLSSDEDSDIDLARGKGNIESSSDEDEEEDDALNLENDNVPDHGWGEMDHEAPRSDESSCRLALCSMDWDRVTASDIFVLLDSFKPTGSVIKSVTIYPSEFGLKRLADEEKSGPAELKEMRSDDWENEWSKDGDEQYNTEKFRQYQLNRLKYYYAVIVCDTINTAEKIYNECDGIEFETSCSKLDLRFIPDGMEFNDHTPKEEITSAPDALTYKPASFITAALNQTRVGLTWDETDHKRTALTTNKFSKEQLENMDVKDFLASGSESEEQDEEEFEESGDFLERRSKMDEKERAEMYRKLLLEGAEDDDNKDDDVDMEITWEPDLKLKVEEAFLGTKTKKVEKSEFAKQGKEERDIASQGELEMIMLGDEGKINGMKGDPKDFKIDVADERFSAMYKSSRYAIDRSDSSFRKSDGTEKILQERQERMDKGEKISDDPAKFLEKLPGKSKGNVELDSLVKSVKSKSAWLGKKSKRVK